MSGFRYKKSFTPRSSMLLRVVFPWEVCHSKPNNGEQNEDHRVKWLFLIFPIIFSCLFSLSNLRLLVSGSLGVKKFPSVLGSRECWLEVGLYLIVMKNSSQLSLLSPLADTEWNSKTILKAAKRVRESSQRQQPFFLRKRKRPLSQLDLESLS